jgi:hypothetical protein
MKALWRRFRAWRDSRRERYAERWTATQPYDSRGDKYLSPTVPGRDGGLPPGSGSSN